jgi:methionine synthase II (cobalamin-independent)
MVFPQYGEVIWNKTHRYFGEQLDGIYITLNGLLKAVKTLEKMCKKWVKRQIEKRKTGGKWQEPAVAKAEKCLMSTQRSPLRPLF